MADVDVVVVGAGFTGIYAVHALRSAGLTVRAFEAGDGIGGTWFWNCYPGARCDVESKDYSYAFSPELEQEWSWSERYPAQPEILRYLHYVADKFGLWPHIQLNTRVTAISWDAGTSTWTVTTEDASAAHGAGENGAAAHGAAAHGAGENGAAAHGASVTARFVVMGVGNLSEPQVPDIPGLGTFEGSWYHTSRWPKDGVDFTGQRVGLIGTGSTGIQIAPEIAAAAEHLYVFQRTANFAVPNRNRPWRDAEERAFKASYRQYRDDARKSILGVPITGTGKAALETPAGEREQVYMERWKAGGGMPFLGAFTDLLFVREANDTVAEFIRDRIRETVADPEVAELLCPKNFPVGAKRLCQSDEYYAMFNEPNVTLVDIRSAPIESAFPGGLKTAADSYELDAIVFATGFDAITGPLFAIDIRGTDGVALRDAWAQGARAYLGVAAAGFPNMFIVTGPGSPGVFSNMVLSIEQHVEWIRDCIRYLDDHGYSSVEADAAAQDAWMDLVTEIAYSTLFPLADSWYVGANIPGKPRVFTSYVGGVGSYRERCDAVAAAGYEGFTLSRS